MSSKTVKKCKTVAKVVLKLHLIKFLGLAKAISGNDATNFARDREFQKMSNEEKEDLVNSRKTMLVIREPLERQDFTVVMTVLVSG